MERKLAPRPKPRPKEDESLTTMDRFYAERRFVDGFPDLVAAKIRVDSVEYLEVVRKDAYHSFVDPNQVVVPVRPARVLISAGGQASMQVLYRHFAAATASDQIFDMLKKLSMSGGHYLCSGLSVEDLRTNPVSSAVNAFFFPMPRVESKKCLLWFVPKSRKAKIFNSLVALCPECLQWKRDSMRLLRRRACRAIAPKVSSEADMTKSASAEEAEADADEETRSLRAICDLADARNKLQEQGDGESEDEQEKRNAISEIIAEKKVAKKRSRPSE